MTTMLKSNPRNADQYRYVKAWYGLSPRYVKKYYIRAQQLQAVVDDAPLDAVFFRGGRWVRLTELSNELRSRVEELAHEV